MMRWCLALRPTAARTAGHAPPRTLSTVMASSTRPQTFYNPLPHEEDSRPVIPKWWTGSNAVPESEFVVDCAKLFPGLPSLAELCVECSDAEELYLSSVLML